DLHVTGVQIKIGFYFFDTHQLSAGQNLQIFCKNPLFARLFTKSSLLSMDIWCIIWLNYFVCAFLAAAEQDGWAG
ncbi:MAG: hypothetical protein Q3X07_06580, partial [Gemmiger sp.]|nr:hypothetical protein [Gemmiger sp.]